MQDDDWEKNCQSTYKFVTGLIYELYNRTSNADVCLRLYVFAGQIADQGGFEDTAYDLFAQAFSLYEDGISDSRAQYQALMIIAGSLQQTRNFSTDNYDTLINKTAKLGTKLLQKPAQCRAVYQASHLWWASEIPSRSESDEKDVSLQYMLFMYRGSKIIQLYYDGKRVLECLQKALKVADACIDATVKVELFIEILNQYQYYKEKHNDAVRKLNRLRALTITGY